MSWNVFSEYFINRNDLTPPLVVSVPSGEYVFVAVGTTSDSGTNQWASRMDVTCDVDFGVSVDTCYVLTRYLKLFQPLYLDLSPNFQFDINFEFAFYIESIHLTVWTKTQQL